MPLEVGGQIRVNLDVGVHCYIWVRTRSVARLTSTSHILPALHACNLAPPPPRPHKQDGMDDESFEQLFVPLMDNIMARYQPDAIVLQSGECWEV